MTRKVTYNQISSGNPEAHITVDKSRLKKYEEGKTVYLNDGTEFEIELYNPLDKRVLVKILMNGLNISEEVIVLNPGQRIFLERFLNTNNSFIFKTYDVKRTNQNLKAIEKNGKINIKFYPEVELVNQIIYYQLNYDPCYDIRDNNPWDNNPWYKQRYDVPWCAYNDYTSLNKIKFNYTGTSNSAMGSSNSAMSSSNSATIMSNSKRKSRGNINENIETGRIEKGEQTDQIFSTTDGNFSNFSIIEFEYHIKPFSQKYHKPQDMLRHYCPNCRAKVKFKDKFCSYCGHKL